MLAQIKKIIKDCGTENDGQSWDFVRVIAMTMTATGFPSFLAMTAYSIYASPEHHFDMVAFGGAFGAMLGGVAAVAGGVAFKQRSDR